MDDCDRPVPCVESHARLLYARCVERGKSKRWDLLQIFETSDLLVLQMRELLLVLRIPLVHGNSIPGIADPEQMHYHGGP